MIARDPLLIDYDIGTDAVKNIEFDPFDQEPSCGYTLDYIVTNEYPSFATFTLGSLILVSIETSDIMLGLPGNP